MKITVTLSLEIPDAETDELMQFWANDYIRREEGKTRFCFKGGEYDDVLIMRKPTKNNDYYDVTLTAGRRTTELGWKIEDIHYHGDDEYLGFCNCHLNPECLCYGIGIEMCECSNKALCMPPEPKWE